MWETGEGAIKASHLQLDDPLDIASSRLGLGCPALAHFAKKVRYLGRKPTSCNKMRNGFHTYSFNTIDLLYRSEGCWDSQVERFFTKGKIRQFHPLFFGKCHHMMPQLHRGILESNIQRMTLSPTTVHQTNLLMEMKATKASNDFSSTWLGKSSCDTVQVKSGHADICWINYYISSVQYCIDMYILLVKLYLMWSS